MVQSAITSSKTFDRFAVKAIGRISSSQVAGCTFGMGVRSASFQGVGNSPDNSDWLKIKATVSATVVRKYTAEVVHDWGYRLGYR